MQRHNNRRRGRGRGPVIHVHNNNSAKASARSKSDACVVWMAVILTAFGSLVAVCLLVPGGTAVVTGTAMAYTANMIRQ